MLRYITNKPLFNETSASIKAGYANTACGDDSYNVEGVLNLPIIDDTLAARVVVYQDHRGGYIDNVFSTFTRRGTDWASPRQRWRCSDRFGRHRQCRPRWRGHQRGRIHGHSRQPEMAGHRRLGCHPQRGLPEDRNRRRFLPVADGFRGPEPQAAPGHHLQPGHQRRRVHEHRADRQRQSRHARPGLQRRLPFARRGNCPGLHELRARQVWRVLPVHRLLGQFASTSATRLRASGTTRPKAPT